MSADSAGIVLARQMRLQKQASEVGGQADQGPRVLVEPSHPSAGARVYDIPITIRGYVETPGYAKIPGYLKTIYVDKGDRVKKGQVITILESPETDKQVVDAPANYKLQAITYDRYKYLLKNRSYLNRLLTTGTHRCSRRSTSSTSRCRPTRSCAPRWMESSRPDTSTLAQ